MNKGERSRQRILKDAMQFSCVYGLSSVTIGEISKMTGMSRTGVISHFNSKEDMQIAILKYSENEYRETVVKPAYDEDALAHLNNHFKLWTNWIQRMEFNEAGSCPFIKAIIEYQDREDSEVKSTIKSQQKRLIEYLASIVKRCIDQGHFKKGLDPYDFTFEVYSFYVGHNIAKNLTSLKDANKRVYSAVSKLIENSLNN